MDIGYVLRRAWEITWRHKAPWLFGFLVSLGTVGTRLSVSAIRWEQLARELLVEVHSCFLDAGLPRVDRLGTDGGRDGVGCVMCCCVGVRMGV